MVAQDHYCDSHLVVVVDRRQEDPHSRLAVFAQPRMKMPALASMLEEYFQSRIGKVHVLQELEGVHSHSQQQQQQQQQQQPEAVVVARLNLVVAVLHRRQRHLRFQYRHFSLLL
jgi:hypothetical protein